MAWGPASLWPRQVTLILHCCFAPGADAGSQHATYDARLHRVEDKVDQLLAGLGDFMATMQQSMQSMQAGMTSGQGPAGANVGGASPTSTPSSSRSPGG